MTIELYGLPGSGKSTFARSLIGHGYEIVSVPTRWGLIFWNIIFFSRYPIKTIGLFIFLLRFGCGGFWRLKFTNLFLHHNARLIKAKLTHRLAVIDQGHFTDILSLFENVADVKKLKKYLKFIPKPDTLLIFNIDEKERERRLAKRGRPLRAGFPQAEVRTW